MIAGYEIETKPLDEYEKSTVLPRIVSGLSLLKKSGRILSSTRIIERLAREGITLTGPRFRKIINYIRVNHIVRGVVADDKGYAVVQDPDKILEYLDGLDSRIEAITAMRNALYEDYQALYIDVEAKVVNEPTLFIEPPDSDPIPEPEQKSKPTQAQLALQAWMEENALTMKLSESTIIDILSNAMEGSRKKFAADLKARIEISAMSPGIGRNPECRTSDT